MEIRSKKSSLVTMLDVRAAIYKPLSFSPSLKKKWFKFRMVVKAVAKFNVISRKINQYGIEQYSDEQLMEILKFKQVCKLGKSFVATNYDDEKETYLHQNDKNCI